MSSLKSRISDILEAKKIKVGSLERELKLANAIISKFINGDKKDLAHNTLELIANKYPDLNPTWLLTGEGEMLRGEENSSHAMSLYHLASPLDTPKTNYTHSSYVLPFFESASAGYIVGWGDVTDDVYYESYGLDTHREQLVRGFVVAGDSMSPTLNVRDIVFCRRIIDIQNHRFNFLNLYVVVSHDGILIKRVQERDGAFNLVSDNKRYGDMLLEKEYVYEIWRCEKHLSDLVHSR